MWPFKKKKFITLSEAIANKPMPPCDEKEEHYRWTDIEGWPCPMCSKIDRQESERKEKEAMAEMIAEKVAAKLKSQ